ncbi:MAG: RagB/SusD family nutrient uptake outer membrane protein [Gemmatimonadetes bacterium]|nr:RagB/SusD family nutrient uptake outer membrane protein [Gemmatimonadota bacterium]
MNRIQKRASALFAAVVVVLLTAGCDVTNPGPVQDAFLNQPASHQALVSGSLRMLAVALAGNGDGLAYNGALPAREIMPGGQTGNHGHDVLVQAGHFIDGGGGVDAEWGNTQQARYIAENAIFRFIDEGAIPAAQQRSSKLLAQAYNWAGHASRLLGEHWCHAVFDGGSVEPGSKYFERAEAHFTKAIEVASAAGDTQLRTVATAGRAQVRVWLGKWTDAAADAKQVADNFRLALKMEDIDPDTRHALYWASAGIPYAAYTTWNTLYGDGTQGIAGKYYSTTGDPRVRWGLHPKLKVANASLSGYGQVPFHQQLKHTSPSGEMRLAGGTEMRLIEAEALLVKNDWQGAMALINAVRTKNVSDKTKQALQAWTATSAVEAWRFLKRERGIELWLEGRRFGDLRRWEDAKAPGTLDWPNFEAVSNIFRENKRSRCFSIPDGERDANPNVPQEIDTKPLWAP